MSDDLDRLEELAPDLADWWRARRREVWREVGLGHRPQFVTITPRALEVGLEIGKPMRVHREPFIKKRVPDDLVSRALRRARDIEIMQNQIREFVKKKVE